MQANILNIMRAALFMTLSTVAVGQAPATTAPAPEVSASTPPAVMAADPSTTTVAQRTEKVVARIQSRPTQFHSA